MPEGHTIHRLAGSLNGAFVGTVPAISSPQGRFVEGAALLDGRPFHDAQAWGKHLFAEFAGDRYLHVHLGLIGSFDVSRYAPEGIDGSGLGGDDAAYPIPAPLGAVRLRLLTATHVADLRAMALVRVATPPEVDAVVDRLGPDPLRSDADPDRAWARITKSSRSIADLLMDQAVLAGVGNVYRCEVLFRHRVDPWRPGTEIRRRTWQALWDDLALLLPIGVQLGQIVTMADQVEDVLAGDYDPSLVPTSPTGVSAWRPNPHGALERRYYVYKRAGMPCAVCGSNVRTAVVAGRNLFWCGRCQRRR